MAEVKAQKEVIMHSASTRQFPPLDQAMPDLNPNEIQPLIKLFHDKINTRDLSEPDSTKLLRDMFLVIIAKISQLILDKINGFVFTLEMQSYGQVSCKYLRT